MLSDLVNANYRILNIDTKVAQLQAALDNEREYTVPEEHDPSLLLFQGTHQLGVATLFTEPIVYMMATEVCTVFFIFIREETRWVRQVRRLYCWCW